MLYGKVYRNGNIAFTTCLSELMVEDLPDALQGFYTVIWIEQIHPSSSLQLQDVPGLLVGGGWIIAVTVGQDIKVAFVHTEVED